MAETTGLIEQYAQHLERKASGLVLRFTVVSGFVGALLGGFPLFHTSNGLIPHHLGYATLMLGAAAGAYLGWSTGERRAVEPRLQAQLALRQLQVEQTLMRGAVARPAAPAPVAAPVPAPAPPAVPVPAPAPVAAPVPQPAPVAPPAPAPAAVRPPAPVAPPPMVQVASTPPPVAPAPAPAPVEEQEAEPMPPAAVAPAPVPPRLVQPPLSSTGA